MSELKSCPCGETPTDLGIQDELSGKWIIVTPDCCGEWSIETRNNYSTGDERIKNAVDAWNDAPRISNNTNILKDHEIGEMVNELTEVAKTHCHAQALRGVLSAIVVKYLKEKFNAADDPNIT